MFSFKKGDKFEGDIAGVTPNVIIYFSKYDNIYRIGTTLKYNLKDFKRFSSSSKCAI